MNFAFRGKLWRWKGDAPAAWHFITLPPDVGKQVRFFAGKGRGFGSVRVTATIGSSRWTTSLFPDKKTGSYLLPVKAEIRRLEKLQDERVVALRIDLDI